MSSFAYGLLWVFVFAVPWENMVLFPGIGTIGRLLGLIAALVGIVAILTRGQFRRLATFHVVAACYIIWAALTIVWSVDQAGTLQWIQSVSQAAAIPWLIWELAGTSRRRANLLQAYVLGAYVSSFDTFMHYRSGISRFTGRFAAQGFNPNDLGFLLALALPMAWQLGITHRNLIVRWVNRLYIPVGAIAVLLTGSRSSFVAVMMALSVVPFTMPWLTRRMKFGALGVSLASAIAIGLYVPPATWKRLATTGEEIGSGTLNNRRVIWKAALELFPRYPIGGVGAGALPEAIGPFLGEDKTSHNTYISVLIEEGAVGITLFTLMLVSLFFHARAATGPGRRVAFVIFVMLLVGLLPRAWEHYKVTWLMFGLLLVPSDSSVFTYTPGSSPRIPPPTIRRFGRAPTAGTPVP